MLAFDAHPPPLSTDEHGVIRVGGTRVTLDSVVIAFDRGASAEEILESYPTLNLAVVYATIAYALQHRPEVDEYLERRRRDAEQTRAEIERRFPAEGIRARLIARRRGLQSE